MIEFSGVTFCFALFGWLALASQFSHRGIAPVLSCAFIYTGILATWTLAHPIGARAPQLIFSENLSLHALLALAMGLAFVGWPRRAVQLVGVLLHLLTMVTTAVLAFFPSLTPAGWYTAGIILNPGLNASMMVVTYPFITKTNFKDTTKAVFLVVTIFVVIASRSLTPCLTFAAMVTANHFGAYRWSTDKKYTWAVRAAKAAAPVLVLGFLFDAPGENQRLYWWRFFFIEWTQNLKWVLFGAGPNQFTLIGPLLQLGHEITERWAHLHSDLFQVAFELGLPGMILWGLVIRRTLIHSKDRYPEFFSAQVAFLVPLLFYFPLHASVGAIVAALLLWPLVAPESEPRGFHW